MGLKLSAICHDRGTFVGVFHEQTDSRTAHAWSGVGNDVLSWLRTSFSLLSTMRVRRQPSAKGSRALRIAVSMLLLAAGEQSFVLAQPAELISVSGLVLDAATERGLAADVAAYLPDAADGDCSTVRDVIDQVRSDASTGAFVLDIPRDAADFVVEFCVDGYIRRVLTISARERGDPVRNPVMVVPLLERLNQPVPAYSTALSVTLESLASDLAYLAGADPQGFARAANGLSEQDRVVIDALYVNAEPRTEPASGQTQILEALERLLGEASERIRYFAEAGAPYFQPAVQELNPNFQEAIRQLLDR